MDEHKFPPVYKHSFKEAVIRGELDQFRASRAVNDECAKAIDAAIEKYFDPITYEWNTGPAADEVVGKFGFDRTMTVLANTVQHYSWDGRFSSDVMEWARTMPHLDKQAACLISANAGWLDDFVCAVLYRYELPQPLKASEIKQEANHILKSFQVMSRNHKSRNHNPGVTHMAILLSSSFTSRAKPEDYQRLTEMVPFRSLTISPEKGGPYALVSVNEDPDRQLRKPSIKKQLAAKPVPGDKPVAKAKDREVR